MLITEDVMIDVEEVRARLGISDSTVRRLIKEGKLRAYRIGRQLKFKPEEIDAYIDAQLVQPSELDDEEASE